MDYIISLLQSEEIRQNRLLSNLFEFINLEPDSLDYNIKRDRLKSEFIGQNQTNLLILDHNGIEYYIYESDFNKYSKPSDNIGLYRLNYDLAGLELVGLIKNGEIIVN